MIYDTAEAWRSAKTKRVLLFGMSGLGKTHLATMLRAAGGWFHYSIDYRIGTRYMGEHIVDNFKREAMKTPFLAQLLRTDSIYIASNITFNNLAPLSTYLGKPGNAEAGGISFDEYRRRQEQHRVAEVNALLDTGHFVDRARALYNYDNFVCDTGGSICEVVDPEDPEDPVLSHLSQTALMVWIKGTEAHTEELVRRFDRDPKPMYYEPTFLERAWADYRAEHNLAEADVDPDDFARSTYARALGHRQPRYAAMAKSWGLTITAEEAVAIRSAHDFETVIGRALEAKT